MKKKLLALLIASILVLSLAACGAPEAETTQDSQVSEEVATDTTTSVNPVAPETDLITITVGASPAPHSEILEAAKPILLEKGINLVIQEFSDYILPNLAVADGSIDANYFQHEPYLIDFNAGNSTDLIAAAKIHYEPMGIYSTKTDTLDSITEGAKIAVPNDTTNEARALLLLEANGLLKIREGAGITATILDITENPLNIEIVEVEASQTPAVLPDVDYAVINSNYALEAKVIDTVITSEDENSVAIEYANIIAVRSGDEARPEIQTLVEVLKSEEVKAFISERYSGSVVVYEG